MTWSREHTQWFVRSTQRLSTVDHKSIELWEFLHQPNERILSTWAQHFRNHYCRDSQIDLLIQGTGLSRADFLRDIKFPNPVTPLGRGIRSGDFSEILIADFIEFILGYWVPRTRYVYKTVRDESTMGNDVIGFKFATRSLNSSRDTLVVFEVKAQFSTQRLRPRLQDAINGTINCDLKTAESLNAIKQNLLSRGKNVDALRVERFQNPEDLPYKLLKGAVAFIDSSIYDPQIISSSSTSDHPNKRQLRLFVFHGQQMLNLVDQLYRRAADEA